MTRAICSRKELARARPLGLVADLSLGDAGVAARNTRRAMWLSPGDGRRRGGRAGDELPRLRVLAGLGVGAAGRTCMACDILPQRGVGGWSGRSLEHLRASRSGWPHGLPTKQIHRIVSEPGSLGVRSNGRGDAPVTWATDGALRAFAAGFVPHLCPVHARRLKPQRGLR
jgi:hypothetical protein